METKSFSEEFLFTQDDVILFAEVSRDRNPIHIDDEYASTFMFGKPIIHGFLGASIFSKIIGMDFPGEGTIYLKQDLKFMAPMFVNNIYMATVELLQVFSEKGRALLKTIVTDSNGKIVIEGEALVQNVIFKSHI